MVALRDSARTWENECIEAIEELRPCGDCYVFFEKIKSEVVDINIVCSKPHLIVWAQCGEYPYWPAKVARIEKTKFPVRVHFLGHNSEAPVTYSNCYLYSKEDPNEYFTDEYKERIKTAVEVSLYY